MTALTPDAASSLPLAARALAPAALPVLPLFAGDTPLRWRPARRSDAKLIHALAATAGRLDHPRTPISKAEVALGLTGARFERRTDTALAIGPRGNAIAFGSARCGDTVETEIEIALDGVVHPDHRGRGVGRALLSWQEARARQILAGSGTALPGIITATSRAENARNQALYAAAGFERVRSWLELRRPLHDELPAGETPEHVVLVPFSNRLSEATRAAVNDAFRDHWGTQPISRREWERGARIPGFAPELSRLAITGRGTAADPVRVVGFVISRVDREAWDANGGPFGELEMIGVVRAWRGRGLSTALIAAALRAHRAAGLGHVMLNVDAENPSGALAMYERLGFRTEDRAVTTAKRV